MKTINYKRALGGALLTAAIAGGFALTAAAPASATTTVDTAVVKAAVQGDRIQGPWIMTNDYMNQYIPTHPWVYASSGTTYGNASGITRAQAVSAAITASFPAVGTTGPVMVGDQCVTQGAVVSSGGFLVTLSTCVPDSPAQQFLTNADGTISFPQVPGTYLQFTVLGVASQVIAIATPAQTNGAQYVERLDLTALTPVAAADCTAGLTGSVSNVNQAGKSAVVSGTGKSGETITVAGGSAPVTAVVDASGNWTATVAGLAEGDNALTVNSSDNCAPVALSVIIDPLEIPVMHPAAAAGAAVLGLGIFGFGGLLRRRKAAQL